MEINLQNIEELIFFDKKIQSLFPEFRYLFDQWSIGKKVPGMQNLGKRSVLNLLNYLETEHIQKLEEYFGDTISVDKIDYHIIKHYEGFIGDDHKLCQFADYIDCCVYRDAERVFITYWK